MWSVVRRFLIVLLMPWGAIGVITHGGRIAVATATAFADPHDRGAFELGAPALTRALRRARPAPPRSPAAPRPARGAARAACRGR